MLQGVLTGLALCLLVYSLAQWVSLRDALFIQYALLISGSLLFSLQFFGVGAQYLWTDNLWMERHASGVGGPHGHLRLLPVHWPKPWRRATRATA